MAAEKTDVLLIGPPKAVIVNAGGKLGTETVAGRSEVRALRSQVTDQQEQIDELLSTYAHGWTIERMPGVDRSVLRLGAWELIYNDDVPDAVAIDEAVELVRLLSTDESPGFVNGLLARLLEVKPTLAR